ncbi:monoacylglycerol lipase ABHD6 isoform X2 [Amborella trichopoda]|uniref:monoacylglycerol lipase ABHD6 isoform X2 n=1 Tax=Amborella trichopoda TaxID=13333 RepID=UPI0005D372E4|nr:monoacylglycerol lipase ABHD6 isoform X2 [Amborella trichopoda]|eukprot:XP_011621113.1 monoacylglycerol lipase ABHD6 isoform X2 [Amborella trichopoda]
MFVSLRLPPRVMNCQNSWQEGLDFPTFLPKEVQTIRDSAAIKMAKRIVRLPVKTSFTEHCIMSSCVKPYLKKESSPIVLLHGFDSSCLEWRYAYPLLEDALFETWAVDILGWGFSDLEKLPSCNVASKREHLYQFWKSYIKRPMVLVGPSLGAAVAIDFAINHPEAVSNLVLIDASVYAEGVGHLIKLPRMVAYAAIGCLHCLFPWWKEATLDFMLSGGYNVVAQIKQLKQRTLIIWGEKDNIISSKLAQTLHDEIQESVLYLMSNCGHIPHVEKPSQAAKLIMDFVKETEGCSLNVK